MEPIITFARENVAVMVVIGVIFAPVYYLYKKKVAPVLFHVFEFFIYMAIVHYVTFFIVKIIAWYKGQTADPGYTTPFTAPWNPLTDSFLDLEVYHPDGILYFELIMSIVVVYIVVVVRPTTYSTQNTYKGDKERGMGDGTPKGRARYDRGKATAKRGKK